MNANATLICWSEAMQLLRESGDDLILNQFLNHANYVVLDCFETLEPDELPITNVDLLFFLGIVRDCCSAPDFLRAVLDRRPDLSVFDQMISVRASRKAVLLCAEPDDTKMYRALSTILGLTRNYFLDKLDNDATVGFVCFREAMKLLDSVEHSTRMSPGDYREAIARPDSAEHFITMTLLHYANHTALMALTSRRQRPAADLDLYFFTTVMERFYRDHDFLRRVLNGEDLRWFSDGTPTDHLFA